MLLHTLGVPRAEVGITYEQPLPWRAAEVHVCFNSSGSAITGRVSRCPGDVLRVEHDQLDVPLGTQAEIRWTQNGRGSFAACTVVAGPPGSRGVHLRVDQSVLGIERRLEARVPVRIPARLITPDGHVVAGSTLNLSGGGAHVVAEPLGHDEHSEATLARIGVTNESPFTVELSLPGGPVRIRSVVTGVNQGSGTVRLRFLDAGGPEVDRIETFLQAGQSGVAG